MGRTPTLFRHFAISLDHLQRLVPSGGGDVRVRCTGLLCRDDKTNAPGMCGISPRQPPRRLIVDTGRTVISRNSGLNGTVYAIARNASADTPTRVDPAKQWAGGRNLGVLDPALKRGESPWIVAAIDGNAHRGF